MNAMLPGAIAPVWATDVGLEVQPLEGGEWQRLDLRPLGGKWWAMNDYPVEEVARRLGPGRYRPIYADPADHRRRHVGQMFVIDVAPPAAPQPQPEAPSEVPGPPPPVDVPPGAPQAASYGPPVGWAHPAGVARPAGPPRARMALPGQPVMSAPPMMVDPNHPLFQLMHLDAMNEAKYARAQEAFQRAMLMQIEIIKAEASANIERERARADASLAATRDYHRALAEATNRAPAASPEVAALQTKLALIEQAHAQKLAELERAYGEEGDDEDDEREQISELLARLSDNPSDAERYIVGIQNLFVGLAGTPAGQKLVEWFTNRQNGHVVQMPAPPPVEAQGG